MQPVYMVCLKLCISFKVGTPSTFYIGKNGQDIGPRTLTLEPTSCIYVFCFPDGKARAILVFDE